MNESWNMPAHPVVQPLGFGYTSPADGLGGLSPEGSRGQKEVSECLQ